MIFENLVFVFKQYKILVQTGSSKNLQRKYFTFIILVSYGGFINLNNHFGYLIV